jgi:ADP-ribosylglycohydrolase
MRAAIIGAFFWDEPQMRRSFILASTKITHTDERAVIGALAVADIAAAARAGIQDDATILQILRDVSPDSQWLDLVSKLEDAGASGMSVSDFADSLGLRNGITGFVFHTAPVAIYHMTTREHGPSGPW